VIAPERDTSGPISWVGPQCLFLAPNRSALMDRRASNPVACRAEASGHHWVALLVTRLDSWVVVGFLLDYFAPTLVAE
jgi:hypothetical protein